MLSEPKITQAESKATFWQRHIENCMHSSFTQAEYCQQHSLALATFGYWKRKLKLTKQKKAHFYPLTVQAAPKDFPPSFKAGLSVKVGKGRFHIELVDENFSAAALKKLIPILEQL